MPDGDDDIASWAFLQPLMYAPNVGKPHWWIVMGLASFLSTFWTYLSHSLPEYWRYHPALLGRLEPSNLLPQTSPPKAELWMVVELACINCCPASSKHALSSLHYWVMSCLVPDRSSTALTMAKGAWEVVCPNVYLTHLAVWLSHSWLWSVSRFWQLGKLGPLACAAINCPIHMSLLILSFLRWWHCWYALDRLASIWTSRQMITSNLW